jgi:predicted nuclease of predicted toxin-antitoxin system
VAARLLLDENLSERLLPQLINLFPGSTHVRTLGRSGASDTSVWDIARDGGFLLVTRDEDFVGMSLLRGAPPKVGSISAMREMPSLQRYYVRVPTTSNVFWFMTNTHSWRSGSTKTRQYSTS